MSPAESQPKTWAAEGATLSAEPELPDLFAVAPVTLFGPLGSPYARVYWTLLARLYRFKFEGSPLELPKGVVAEYAEEALSSSAEWSQRRSEFLASLQDVADPESGSARQGVDELRGAARRVVRRLEVAGWFYFEYQRGMGEVLNFPPYAARLLGQMMSVARDEQPIFPGYAHAVHTMLRRDNFARLPGPAIAQVKRDTLEFARELRILHGNIRESIQRVFDADISTAQVLREALDLYEERVRRNYHLLKTRDNIFAWRVEVMGRIDVIGTQQEHLEEAARWYSEQQGIQDPGEALRRVREDLRVVRSHIEAMPRVMHEIDERNQRFTGIATRRVSYLLRHDQRTEGQLQFLIDGLGKGRISALELNVFEARFLDPDCLYVPRRQPVPVRNTRLKDTPQRNADEARNLFARRLLSPYRLGIVELFVEQRMPVEGRLLMRELPLLDDDDYIRMTYVVSHGSRERARYRFIRLRCRDQGCQDPTCNQCHVRYGRYSVPNGILEWKGQVPQ